MSEETKVKLGIALIAGLLFGGLTYLILMADRETDKKRIECEAKGGTYFYHERACINVQRIPVGK